MECSECQASNPAGNRFCGDCGAALSSPCPACGTSCPADKRFCGECGTALLTPTAAGAPSSDRQQPSRQASEPASASVAERRVCSVLFCDLVGFTPLSEARDPEAVRELLSRYFEVARTVIGRHGGVVEKFIGDAVMAVWGTPTASEQDAERAVRAALELVDAVGQLGREARVEGLTARAGVVTGPVAVTVGAAGEGMVAGDAVNTAARVQAAAQPCSVLVDEGTWRVAQAAIEFTAAGKHRLKGKAEPVSLWRAGRVLSGVAGAQRIDGLEAGFVGRDTELRLIKELFHACVQRRSPRLVSVIAAAGVGKSRLGWEFEKYVDGLADTVWWHRGRCLSYGDGVAFWALAEMARQRLQISDEDPSSVAADKLAAGLERWLPDAAERDYVGPRLAQLLGTSYGDPGPALGQEELFAGWRLFLERLAGQGPVVLVVEDLQYADSGFLDFLEHLLDWARGVPIFVLTFARPELDERRTGWGTGRSNGTLLALEALDEQAMAALLEELVPGMPAAAKVAIADRAEGIALYAVETIRMLIDRDVVQPVDGVYRLLADVGDLAVPATLQSLLAARLDALDPSARTLVADAAVLGSSFPAEALVAVSELAETEVRRLLTELVRREVLSVRADPLSPQRGHYGFLQTMFRQVAYDTLSRRDRKARHLAVAVHLQRAFADEGEEVAEVIAAHLLDALAAVPEDPDVAQLREAAVTTLSRAGERAERTGAPATAATAYATAAHLLQQTETPEAGINAAALYERAGDAAADGGDLVAAISQHREAADIFRRLQRMRDVARVDTAVAENLRRQGRLEEARPLLLGALAVLEQEPDADTVGALDRLAVLHIFAGESTEADRRSTASLSHAQALDLGDRKLSRLFVSRGIAHISAARLPQASANLREAIRRAQGAQDSRILGVALLNLAELLNVSDPAAAAEAADAAAAHCRRVGNRYLLEAAVGNWIQSLLLLGEWEAAARVRDTGAHDDHLSEGIVFHFAVLLLSAFSGDGDVDLWLGVIQRSADTEDVQDLAQAAAAWSVASAFEGRHAEALEYGHHALAHGQTLGLSHDSIRWAWPTAADAALALGRHPETTELIDWLDDHPPGHIPAILRAERQRISAKLLSVDNVTDAGSAFNTAVHAFREMGSPYHLAVCLLEHAEHLAASGDVTAAEPLMAEATTIARRLGAEPLLARAQRLETPTAGRGAPPVHTVSPGERRLLR